MKRFIDLLLICLFVLSMTLSGCSQNVGNSQSSTFQSSSSQASTSQSSSTRNSPAISTVDEEESEVTEAPDDRIIKFWSYTHELTEVLNKFKELHPDFGYEINLRDFSNSDVTMQTLLDTALAAGGSDAPDIYAVESAYAVKYTQGEASQYAAAYKDLGIDIDNLIKEAAIAKYAIDMGTNPEGQIVGLGYQSTAGTFIYRRSIAKRVWGTDDPSAIRDIVGPGWDKFLAAAADLKAKRYSICSSVDDIWQVVTRNVNQGWVVGGKLFIDPNREEFIDLAMKLKKNGYINNTRAWTDGWYNDFKDGGNKKVFGFFGPSWFLNYVMIPYSSGKTIGEGNYGDWAVCDPPISYYWGGTWILANKDTREKNGVAEILKWMTLDTSETGLQYLWANDKLGNGVKDAVISAAVMKESDGKIDFLGGQNQFDAFISAGENASGKNATKYDEILNFDWLGQVHEYIDGKKTREQAIDDFKKLAKERFDDIVE